MTVTRTSGVTKHAVLVVEDHRQSVSATLDRITGAEHELTLVADAADAERELRHRAFDLVLLDLRISRDGRYAEEGGLELVESLLADELGATNATAHLAVLTAFPNQLPAERLPVAPRFLGVFSKLGSPVSELRLAARGALEWLAPSADTWQVADALYAEDILTIDGFADDLGRIVVALNGWDMQPTFTMAVEDLPPDLQQELAFNERPVRFWARVNIAAESEDQLAPHEFRLILPAEDESDVPATTGTV